MSNESQMVIETALRLELIDKEQAGRLREEIAMFPGQNVIYLLLKRQIINAAQMTELQKAMADRDPFHSESEHSAPTPPVQKRPGEEKVAPPKPGFSWQTAPPKPESKTPSKPPPLSPLKPPPVSPLRPSHGMAKTFPPSPVVPGVTAKPPVSAPLKPVESKSPAPRPSSLSAALPGITSAMMAAPATPLIGIKAPVSGDLPKPGTNWSLSEYVLMARQKGCSDLHLCPGRPPFIRRRGEVHYMDAPTLTAEQSEKLNFSALSDEQRAIAREKLQIDFAWEVPSIGRHRCNVFRQRLGWEGAYRIIRSEVPTMEDLNLPPILRTLTTYYQGLVLVTGPAGSGKTTTVAAMLDYINRTRDDHIITVEDPIEYVFRPQRCQVTQREVGRHTGSFASALRAALRQDPDVIFVGELRDLETTAIAISAAETGHLVFGTLHTSSAARTIGRILEVYPTAQRQQISTMVAESLRGIISQQLISRRDRRIPALAMEVLLFTSGVAQQVKDGRTHQLVSLMQSGKRIGMRTMDDSLMELVKAGSITGYEAYLRADNKAPFELFKGVK